MSGKLFRSHVKEATDDADVVAADPLGDGDGDSEGERDEHEDEGDEEEGECTTLSQLLIDELGERRGDCCVVAVVVVIIIVCPDASGVSIFV